MLIDDSYRYAKSPSEVSVRRKYSWIEIIEQEPRLLPPAYRLYSDFQFSRPRISRWHSTRLEPRSKRTVRLPEIMMIGRIRLRKIDEQVMLSSFAVDVTLSRIKFASKHAGQLMYLATSSLVIRLSLHYCSHQLILCLFFCLITSDMPCSSIRSPIPTVFNVICCLPRFDELSQFCGSSFIHPRDGRRIRAAVRGRHGSFAICIFQWRCSVFSRIFPVALSTCQAGHQLSSVTGVSFRGLVIESSIHGLGANVSSKYVIVSLSRHTAHSQTNDLTLHCCIVCRMPTSCAPSAET